MQEPALALLRPIILCSLFVLSEIMVVLVVTFLSVITLNGLQSEGKMVILVY